MEKINNFQNCNVDLINLSLLNKSKEFEKKIGLKNLCQSVDQKLEENESLTFIDDYRDLIRNNKWNFDDETETDYLNFLNRWINTHLFYIQSAENFYNYFFNGNNEKFSKIHELAILSENFRGREGKRSKIGLDNILNLYISKLSNLISNVDHINDLDDKINILASSIKKPYFSAEFELFKNFYDFSKINNDGLLTEENILSLEKKTNGLSSKILREFCKYSIKDFNKKYSMLDLSDEAMKRKDNYQTSLLEERKIIENQIYHSLIKKSGRATRDFVLILDRINELNYLNSNLEVKYSFKGWPGLFHHFVFKKGKEISSDNDVYRRQSHINFKEMGGLIWNQYKK